MINFKESSAETSPLNADDDDDEMNEKIDISSTHAAISLQLFLDKHQGGWQNTFG